MSWIDEKKKPEPAKGTDDLSGAGEVFWQLSQELHRMIEFGEDASGLVIDAAQASGLPAGQVKRLSREREQITLRGISQDELHSLTDEEFAYLNHMVAIEASERIRKRDTPN